eukprot:Lankesteria_metandrocarpae@DN4194_c0_g1_i1.p1
MLSSRRVIALATIAVSWLTINTVALDYGRCHVYWPNQPATACGYVPVAADVDSSCGTTAHPCITTMDQVVWGSADCNKCYKLTYTAAEKSDVTCTSGTCPGYTSNVYVKVVDGSSSDAKFEMSQDAFAKLCPYACIGGESCVQDSTTCTSGAYPPKVTGAQPYPGSCSVSKVPITFEEVTCGSGSSSNTGSATAHKPRFVLVSLCIGVVVGLIFTLSVTV